MGLLLKCGLSTFGLLLLTVIVGQMRLRQQPSSAVWIAFTSNIDGGYEIYQMTADGSDLRRLTFDNADNLHASWSPNGRWIAYSSFQNNNYLLHRVSSRGHHSIPITQLEDDDMDHSRPMWSADGETIIYRAALQDRSKGGVFMTKTDHFAPQLLFETIYFPDGIVDWSPDGTTLSVQTREEEFWTIDTYHFATEVRDVLAISETRPLVAPQWSPDGRFLAYFHAGNWEQSHLQIADVETGEVRQIGYNQGLGIRFEWSPDGEWIIFDEWISGIFHLHRANIETGLIERLTPQSHQEHSPAWSPDGEWIVFVRRFGDESEAIYRMRPDGTDRQRLTTAIGLYESPVWSPIIDYPWHSGLLLGISFGVIGAVFLAGMHFPFIGKPNFTV